MILLMRNHIGEFVPGHDYTAVKVDTALVEMVARRAAACMAMWVVDGSLAEAMYWDASPRCIGSPDSEKAEAVEDTLDRGDGWAVMDDGALGSFEAANADCTQMSILAGDSPSVGWSYRVGSEPVRTVDVPLAELAARLGAPLGDPLLSLP